MANDIRTEATNLLEEIKILSHRNEELESLNNKVYLLLHVWLGLTIFFLFLAS